MNVDYTFKICPNHGKTKFIRPATSHLLHLFLTICTGGLWVIVWFISSFKMGGWKCDQCGCAPESSMGKLLFKKF